MIEIPLFPLSAVLLPGGQMPLQIFEQRYLDLVRRSMRENEPFGVVWIRRGAEVAQRGQAEPQLGDYGTLARIVDWDQLPNGLLGITIEGGERFDLHSTARQADGLVIGQVSEWPASAPAAMAPEWASLLTVLESLQAHPHVERLGMAPDLGDAWQVGWTLAQLLPLEEHYKYQLQGLTEAAELMEQLNLVLNEISGEA